MTIDEQIEKARNNENIFKNNHKLNLILGERSPYYGLDCLGIADDNKHLAEWLEELKAYRANEGMSENVYRCGYKSGYNKAINDFAEKLSNKIRCEIDDCADELEWIDEISAHLKGDLFVQPSLVKKVYYADIIVTGTKDKPYYQIKYMEIGRTVEIIGYGSYDLRLVFKWLEKYFEIEKDVK